MQALSLGAAILVSTVVGAMSGVGTSRSARLYLNHALMLMRTQAVVSPRAGWSAITQQARRSAVHAKRPADTYGAIIFVLGQLYSSGDVHAGIGFANPFQAKLQAQAAKRVGTTPTRPPAVSLVDGRIGLVTVPAVISPPDSPNSRRYVEAALNGISTLETASRPCGWIVDLRRNTGGDMYPMLLALGPLLGDGKLVGFTGRSGFDGWASYGDGTLTSPGGYRYTAPVTVPAIDPAPPVALLTGPATLSSGEAVTIAFRGRSDTRSFGRPTGGATTSPRTYRLSDGATITFSVADDVDRNRVVYHAPITPDDVVGSDLPDSAAETAAEQWLLGTPTCSAPEGSP